MEGKKQNERNIFEKGVNIFYLYVYIYICYPPPDPFMAPEASQNKDFQKEITNEHASDKKFNEIYGVRYKTYPNTIDTN